MTSRPQTYPARLTVNLTEYQIQALRRVARQEGRTVAGWARWHLMQQVEAALGLLDGQLLDTTAGEEPRRED